MTGRPELHLIEGGGDVVSVLEAALERARRGEIEGVIVGFASADRHQSVGYGYRDDMDFPWVRLVAVAEDLKNHVFAGLGNDD